MGHGLLVLFAAAAVLRAQAPDFDAVLARVAGEAEQFQRVAPRIVGRETLHHRGRKSAPRLRWVKPGAAANLDPFYVERRLVSDYGFGFFREAPDWLREFRQVVEVDGRRVAPGKDSRRVLASNMTGADDVLRRRLLQDFERHGTVGAASDFGQMILLFRRSALANNEFQWRRTAYVGPDECDVLEWKQKSDGDAARVFSEGRLRKVRMSGELWVRKADHVPVRITAEIPVVEKKVNTMYSAVIDYAPSRFGAVLPASVVHRKAAGDVVLVENRASYSDFQRFTAEAEIKFDAAEDPAGDPQP